MKCTRYPHKEALPVCEMCAFYALCLADRVDAKLRHMGM